MCDYTAAQKPQLLRHMEQHASFKVRGVQGRSGEDTGRHTTLVLTLFFSPLAVICGVYFVLPLSIIMEFLCVLETKSRKSVQEDADRKEGMHFPLKA